MNNFLSVTCATHFGVRRRISKAACGRGCKRAPWVVQLHGDLFDKFHRLQSCDVKFNSNMLFLNACKLVGNSKTGPYRQFMRDPKSGELLADYPNSKWVERFTFAKCIVSSVQIGKLMPSAEKQELVKREIVYPLGVLMREFSIKLWTNTVSFTLMKRTCWFIFNEGRTLAMKGDSEVK